MQRRAPRRNESPVSAKDDGDKEKVHDNRRLVRMFLAVLSLVLAIVFLFPQSTSNDNAMPGSKARSWYEIDSGIKVEMEWDWVETTLNHVSMGSHRVSLVLENSCPTPGLWIRLEGDALVSIVLNEGKSMWTGSFSIPLAGRYDVVVYWYGCEGDGILKWRKVLTNVIVTATTTTNTDRVSPSLFPNSIWISAKKFTEVADLTQPYIWHNPEIPTSDATLFKTNQSFVSEESATYPETKFYQIQELSNYELVCWIGSESATMLHSTFLQLRSQVSDSQRPFKFHLYDAKSFQSPDMTWTKVTKTRFRKCKHILVSMDQVLAPLTQSHYVEHVTKFVNHLLKAFPDNTFPIWIFSVMESPTNPTNCLPPTTLPRTSHHPCNTALKELFRTSPFPERVRFLDSSDITLPQLDQNLPDVAAAIALRIFVFVGKQVAEWRAKGQIGTVEGLKRGDVQEPNFKLVPYTDWTK